MGSVIVGFSRARSPWKVGSTIIAATEKRNYSHVYIRYTDPTTGIEIVAQASHGYVNQVAYDIFIQDNIVVEEYDLETTPEQTLEILTFILKNLGKPYSKLQLLFITVKKLFHVTINIRNNDSAFICSELGAKVCKFKKIILEDDLDLETPSDLNTVLRAKGVKRIYG